MAIRETTATHFRVEEDVLGASGREARITHNKASQRLPMNLVGNRPKFLLFRCDWGGFAPP